MAEYIIVHDYTVGQGKTLVEAWKDLLDQSSNVVLADCGFYEARPIDVEFKIEQVPKKVKL